MSMMVSFVLSFFPRDVLDEILNLIESVSEDFPSYSYCDIIPLQILHLNIFKHQGPSNMHEKFHPNIPSRSGEKVDFIVFAIK